MNRGRGGIDWSAEAPVWLAVTATSAALLIGYLIKVQCAIHPWADSFQYSHLCYNDLQPLFGVRGISRGLLPYRDVQLEYPVLTGLFMHLTGVVLRFFGETFNNDRSYFHVSAVFLAPFAYMVTMTMRPRVTASRLMLWAGGTPLVLYAFHNWDLLAVAGTMWGLSSFERGRDRLSGIGIGLGASAKLYSVFLLPGMALERLRTSGLRKAVPLALAFVIAYAVINLPIIASSNGMPGWTQDPEAASYADSIQLRDPRTNGWLGVWKFHADRYPDFGTAWYWLGRHGRVLFPAVGGYGCELAGKGCWWDPGFNGFRDFVSTVSFLLFAGGSVWLLWRGWRRREDGYPVVPVGIGIVALFLLTSKVHSPQYAMWLVPLLAMCDVPWRRVFFYLAFDVGVFVSGFYYFTVMDETDPGWQGIFEVAVLLRTLALGLILASSLTAGRLFPKASEPAAAPEPAGAV